MQVLLIDHIAACNITTELVFSPVLAGGARVSVQKRFCTVEKKNKESASVNLPTLYCRTKVDISLLVIAPPNLQNLLAHLYRPKR